MTTSVHLPDDVVVILEERAAERGVTVAELICDMALRPTSRQALEEFIGCADVPVDGPFDIHRSRADTADELLREHDELGSSARRSPPRSAGRALEVD